VKIRLASPVGLLALLTAGVPAFGPAQAADAPLAARAEEFASQSAHAMLAAGVPARVEIEAGTLDPRLRLAPCGRIEPYLPAGARAWGRTRVGLRCVQGASWNVTMPVTVRVFAPALVATQPLRAGTVVDAGHFRTDEVDLAAVDSPAIVDASRVLGRTLARPLGPGQALYESDLKRRQLFAAGDPVRVVAAGRGFAVTGEAVALTPGFEGQPVRLRSDSGRTIQGVAVGERQAEIKL
jgi:flagellar basal body P-ring formation protein FlgA